MKNTLHIAMTTLHKKAGISFTKKDPSFCETHTKLEEFYAIHKDYEKRDFKSTLLWIAPVEILQTFCMKSNILEYINTATEYGKVRARLVPKKTSINDRIIRIHKNRYILISAWLLFVFSILICMSFISGNILFAGLTLPVALLTGALYYHIMGMWLDWSLDLNAQNIAFDNRQEGQDFIGTIHFASSSWQEVVENITRKYYVPVFIAHKDSFILQSQWLRNQTQNLHSLKNIDPIIGVIIKKNDIQYFCAMHC